MTPEQAQIKRLEQKLVELERRIEVLDRTQIKLVSGLDSNDLQIQANGYRRKIVTAAV